MWFRDSEYQWTSMMFEGLLGCPAPETRIPKSVVRSNVDARNPSNTTKSSPKQALRSIGVATDRRNSIILGVVFLTLLGAG